MQALTWEVSRALTKLGMAIAASRPMMATTIMISTNVNPPLERVPILTTKPFSQCGVDAAAGGYYIITIICPRIACCNRTLGLSKSSAIRSARKRRVGAAGDGRGEREEGNASVKAGRARHSVRAVVPSHQSARTEDAPYLLWLAASAVADSYGRGVNDTKKPGLTPGLFRRIVKETIDCLLTAGRGPTRSCCT